MNRFFLKLLGKELEVSLGFFAVCLGTAGALYLPRPEWSAYGSCNHDHRPAPLFAVYHPGASVSGNMILDYVQYNESTLRNAIHRIGNCFVNSILPSKALAVLSYDLPTLSLFAVGRSPHGNHSLIQLPLKHP